MRKHISEALQISPIRKKMNTMNANTLKKKIMEEKRKAIKKKVELIILKLAKLRDLINSDKESGKIDNEINIIIRTILYASVKPVKRKLH